MTMLQQGLFSGIKEEHIRQILDAIHIKESVFQKGEILAMQDEPCNRLILLIRGSVTAEMTDPAGKIIKVEDLYAPNPLAILFLFGENNRFPVQATAREEVEALVIPKQSVLTMLSMDEQLLKNYLDISAIYASRLSQKLHFMTFRTIRQKLALYFLKLAKQQGDTLLLDRTQESLAEYFGVTRPSLARELKKMQDDNLITISKKQIVIHNRMSLQNLVSF